MSDDSDYVNVHDWAECQHKLEGVLVELDEERRWSEALEGRIASWREMYNEAKSQRDTAEMKLGMAYAELAGLRNELREAQKGES